MATGALIGIKFFEQFLKLTTKGTFLWSLDEIGWAVYEEMSLKVTRTIAECDSYPHQCPWQKTTWKGGYGNNLSDTNT
jgi:hypothetical protein